MLKVMGITWKSGQWEREWRMTGFLYDFGC